MAPMPPVDEAPAARPPRPADRRRTPAKPGAARAAARKVAGVAADGAAAHATAATRPARATTSAAATPAGDAGGLAIPDYDGLSASHVVNRLGGLSAAELEAVRRYEAANRGRKTILSKVAQLQSG